MGQLASKLAMFITIVRFSNDSMSSNQMVVRLDNKTPLSLFKDFQTAVSATLFNMYLPILHCLDLYLK